MKQYAILRIQKINSPISVQRSLKHAMREQDTPNADPKRFEHNTYFDGIQTVETAMDKFKSLLPAKVRKNGVVCVEFLVTASPDIMANKSRTEQDDYFTDALNYISNKHGAHNVFAACIHRDETTPHLSVHVVPNDAKGKLNCRSFYGEFMSLRHLQTDFHEKVGAPHGLERGLEGSKAHHTPIHEYYSQINAATLSAPNLTVLEPKGLLQSKADYGQQVASDVWQQLKPTVMQWRAKATNNDETVRRLTQRAEVAEERLAAERLNAKATIEHAVNAKGEEVASRYIDESRNLKAMNEGMFQRMSQAEYDRNSYRKRLDTALDTIQRFEDAILHRDKSALTDIAKDVQARHNATVEAEKAKSEPAAKPKDEPTRGMDFGM